MKTNLNKTTPRACHTLRQIVQRIPRWLIVDRFVEPGGSNESGYDIMCGMEKIVIDTHSFTGIGEGAFK